ncbi:MAG: hypothetical protein JXR48_03415 [Candidatus Delongbacteria bacterium]|nr:hypothetical protein [Candidatus Delongbacteria bacterium]MBN2833996.1 hypothetical protein [Candidatus Delongbacteria bacterium]
MKWKIFIKLSIFLLVVSCALEQQLFFGVEETVIKIPFGKKTYDFLRMDDNVDLDSASVGDSLKFDYTLDSIAMALYELTVDGTEGDTLINFPFTVASGLPILSTEIGKDLIIYDNDDPQFRWAMVDSGDITISIENKFEELGFEKIIVEMFMNEESLDPDLGVTNFIIFRDSIVNLTPGEIKSFTSQLNGKYITDNMQMNISGMNYELTSAQNTIGVDDSQYLGFNYELSECTFDSTKVKSLNDSISKRDLIELEYENINIEWLKVRDADLRINIDNHTPFNMTIDVVVDSLFSLVGDSVLYNIDQFTIADGEVYKNRYDLNQTIVYFDGNNKTPLSYDLQFNNDGDEYFRFTQADSVFMIVEMTGTSTDMFTEKPFYMRSVKATAEDKEVDFDDEPIELDFDWEGYEGLQIDSIYTLLNAKLSRDDLVFEKIIFDSLQFMGKKKNGEFTEWFDAYAEPLSDFNSGNTRIIGLGNLLNFHPDSIMYRVKPKISFDSIIRRTDQIFLDINFGVPAQATVVDTVNRKGDVEEIEAIDEEGDALSYEVLDFVMDAFVNYQLMTPDSIDVEFWGEIEIMISTNADLEKDSLMGEVQSVLKVKVRDDNFDEHGFYLSDPSVNPYFTSQNGSYIDSDGIHVDKEIADLMLKNKTYIQSVIRLFPTEEGKFIKMTKDDYVEITLKAEIKTILNYDHENR